MNMKHNNNHPILSTKINKAKKWKDENKLMVTKGEMQGGKIN